MLLDSLVSCPIGCESSHFFLKDINNYKIYKCSNCEVTFSSPMKSGDINFYKNYEVYDKPSFEEARISKNSFKNKLINKTIKKLDKKSKILDIGCGYGAFVSICIDKGMDAYGIDFNPDHVNIGKKYFNLGDKIQVSNFDDKCSFFKKNFYDVVSLFEVIEHVENPAKIIKLANYLLKPDGILLLSCPNEDRLMLAGRIFVDYPPHHLTRWNKKSINLLFLKNGFSKGEFYFDCSLRDLIWTFIVNKKISKLRKKKSLNPIQKENIFIKKFLSNFKLFAYRIVGYILFPLDIFLKMFKIGTMGMKIKSKKITN